ncbi:MAG TPA: hypothetical protein DCY55_00130 [Gammaproteobacteria bacterium]|jgi:hypothetical protein|nr:hypothetical protein [Gammaproteobacteria bacterium]
MERGYLKRYSEVWELLFRILDIAIIVACAYVVYWYRFSSTSLPSNYILSIFVACLITIVVFNWFLVYGGQRGISIYKELSRLAISWGVVVLSIGTLTFLTKTGASYSRLWAGWTFFCSFVGFVSIRDGECSAATYKQRNRDCVCVKREVTGPQRLAPYSNRCGD